MRAPGSRRVRRQRIGQSRPWISRALEQRVHIDRTASIRWSACALVMFIRQIRQSRLALTGESASDFTRLSRLGGRDRATALCRTAISAFTATCVSIAGAAAAERAPRSECRGVVRNAEAARQGIPRSDVTACRPATRDATTSDVHAEQASGRLRQPAASSPVRHRRIAASGRRLRRRPRALPQWGSRS